MSSFKDAASAPRSLRYACASMRFMGSWVVALAQERLEADMSNDEGTAMYAGYDMHDHVRMWAPVK